VADVPIFLIPPSPSGPCSYKQLQTVPPVPCNTDATRGSRRSFFLGAVKTSEIEAPKPAGDEILIDVHAASVSFMGLASHLGLRIIADQVEWASRSTAST
jgi:hypothetical protein